jgi:hypothetical protein
MKKNFLISTLLATLLFSTTFVEAKTDNKTLVQHQLEKNKKNEKQVPKEIVEGAQKTFIAMDALHKNKLDKAKKLLTEATADFDKALKNNPNLDIVPIQQTIEIFEFNAGPKEIETMLSLASRLLSNHQTQAARDILLPLKDEMDINTEFIPMGVYPLATKNALSALNKGDKDSAIAILTGAFSMLVHQQIILPLSLLSAQDLVMEASKLDKEKKEEALALLAEAKDELKKSELLGYTTKNSKEYKALTKAIEGIEKEIKGKNIVEKLYESLNKNFTSLINKIQSDEKEVTKKEHKQAILKIKKTEKKELQKAIKEVPTFEKEAKKDENKTVK